MGLPIIFIHKGYSSYLEFSLRQAKHTNPNSKIFLLGDNFNDRFQFITHVNIKDYFSSASEFPKIYKHLSTNPYNFELFCFQRWFVLKDFMVINNIDNVLVCDSDLLLYSDFSANKEYFFKNEVELALCQYKEFATSAHLSYWTTNSIKDFCTFACDSYTEQDLINEYTAFWQKLQSQHKPGGVCDMTTLYFFFKNVPKNRVFNFLDIFNEATCDDNVNEPHGAYSNEYSYKRFKKIQWIKGIPYCHNKRLNKLIKFNTLHFQGPAKYKIPFNYTGEKFEGITRLKILYFILSLCVFIYSKFCGKKIIKKLFSWQTIF